MKLFGKQPNLQLLKVFGCRWYPLLRSYNRHKLQYKSTPYVFLGYVESHKGYKCMDQHGRIYISRHVKFAEHIFPFQKSMSVFISAVGSPWTLTPLPILVQTPSVMTNSSSSIDINDTGSLSSSSERHQSDEVVTEETNGVDIANNAPVDVLENEDMIGDDVDAAGQSVPDDCVESLHSNTHPMVIKSKVGVFKPKFYLAKLSMVEPKNVYKAMLVPSWKKDVDDELKALIKNDT